MAHRTVRCTREINSELLSFGFLESHFAIIHRNVWCAMTEQRLLRQRSSAKVNSESARTTRAKSEQRQKAHRTVNSDYPVHHWTVRWTQLSELQRSNPNGWVTWLAHRTVRCAHRQTASPTTILVGGAINTPNHHTSRHLSFQTSHSIQELVQSIQDTNPKNQSLSKSQFHSKQIVTRERVLLVFFELLFLDRFSSSPF
jgi:hypothetical protein